MSNVIKFERRKASAERPREAENSRRGEGEIRFSIDGDGSDMQLTGVYERRLQFGIYTMIKGINVLVDKLAAIGAIGDSSFGPIHEPLPSPIRRTPRRLREATNFGDLN